MNRKVVILGGTFNPIHNGHVLALHALRDASMFDEIWIMPSGVPPYKQEEYESVEDRFNMVKCIVSDIPGLILREDERYQKGPSYTYNTLKKLSIEYPSTQFYWTIGYDHLETIETWKEGIKLLREYGIVLLNRGGYDSQNASSKASHIRDTYACDIVEIHMPTVEISSTEIRHRVSNQQSVIGYCPECIIDYMKKHKLYQTVKEPC